MTGHFESGVWIEDPKPPREDPALMMKVIVDDTQIRNLLGLLKEMQPLLDRIERVTQDPKKLTEPNLRISVDRTGLGKIYLNDIDISHLTSGFSIQNKAGEGNAAVVIVDPNVDLEVELPQVLFNSDKKRFSFTEVTPE